MERHELHAIPDDELLVRLSESLRQSRGTEADLVAHIAEVDARKLYAREGSPSMFGYCTEVLHLSEAEAYLRIAAARASREHPLLLEMLADGRLHLSGVGKLAPCLTRDNASVLLLGAAHKTKRRIEELIAQVAPRPDAPTIVRKLPERPPAAASPASILAEHVAAWERRQVAVERERAGETPFGREEQERQLRPDAVESPGRKSNTVVEPLAAGRYKVQFTASATLKGKLERLQALMRSQVSDGDLSTVIEAAVTEKLERLEAKRSAATGAPRKTLANTSTAPTTRHIPAAVRRAVRERDGDRCRYVSLQGRRCSERERLEFHHVYPFGLGGDHNPANVTLLCRAHNMLAAEVDYGRSKVARTRAREATLGAEGLSHISIRSRSGLPSGRTANTPRAGGP